jgi:hypothetical protein
VRRLAVAQGGLLAPAFDLRRGARSEDPQRRQLLARPA